MSKSASLITGLGRNANLGFIAVTIAAYISAVTSLSYQSRFFSPLWLITLVAASILYLIIGTVGYSFTRRKNSLLLSVIYFAVQISLAVSILYLRHPNRHARVARVLRSSPGPERRGIRTRSVKL